MKYLPFAFIMDKSRLIIHLILKKTVDGVKYSKRGNLL